MQISPESPSLINHLESQDEQILKEQNRYSNQSLFLHDLSQPSGKTKKLLLIAKDGKSQDKLLRKDHTAQGNTCTRREPARIPGLGSDSFEGNADTHMGFSLDRENSPNKSSGTMPTKSPPSGNSENLSKCSLNIA